MWDYPLSLFSDKDPLSWDPQHQSKQALERCSVKSANVSFKVAKIYKKIDFNCQALVPSPVPLDQIPIQNPKQSKIQSPIGTGDDTKITWATPPHHP